LSLYLDASILVALFTDEPSTARIQRLLQTSSPILIVSDFAAAEFASAVARRVRAKMLTRDDARHVFSTFDVWIVQAAVRERTMSSDIVRATAFLRRLDLTLRAPDAINIAVAHRINAELCTLDKDMATSARKLRTRVVSV
jgi:predicted nucleic acid-binding protein